MATAFDAAATPAFSNAGVTSLTSNLTVGAGSNRYLIAGVLSGAGTPLQPSAVKWGGSGGAAMTQLGTTIDIGSNVKLSLWGIIAPASGANTIYASWASAQDETAIVGAAYTGVDQSTPTRTVAQATGANATPTVNATSVSGDFVIDVAGFLDGNGASLTLTVGAGQTSHGEVEGANLVFEGLGTSHEAATTSSTTMSWTISGTPQQGWGILAAALIPSTGSGATSYHTDTGTNRPRPGRGPYSTGQYFRPSVDPITSPPNLIVSLTGSTLSSSAGTLGPTASLGLSGQAASMAAGTLSPAVSRALTGSALSSAAGTLIPSFSIALTGQVIASAQGSVSAGGDLILALTGQALTLASGTIVPDAVVAVVGSALASSTGILVPALSKALSGSAFASAQGSVSPALSLVLSGNLLTTAQGTVSTPGGVTLALTGQAVAASQGSFAPAASKALTGDALSVTTGSVVFSPYAALTGSSLAVSLGSLAVSSTVSLTGSLASMTQGTVFNGAGNPYPPDSRRVTVHLINSKTVH